MKKIPLALGLYSVRDELKRDWKATLKAVSDMGYTGVEFYGPMSYPVDELKAVLDECSLRLVGWHIGYADINDDTVKYNRALGNNRLVVPGLPAEFTCSADAWKETARKFCEAADYLRAEGFELGYHNHDTEYSELDGEIPWDIFAKGTEGKVFLQLDNGNAMKGGADTLEILRKYPGRCHTIHFKPYSLRDGYATMIGEDDVPWIETFDELDRQGVTDWYIIEYECEEHYTQLGGVEACISALKKMGL